MTKNKILSTYLGKVYIRTYKKKKKNTTFKKALFAVAK